MNVLIQPGRLAGTVRAIPSKSDVHRLLIAAALADACSDIALAEYGADVAATIDCLGALGAGIARHGQALRVSPLRLVAGSPLLDCRASGSTLRFLLPIAAALYENVTLCGTERLGERPIAPLLACMAAQGCRIGGDGLPLVLHGRLQSGRFVLPGEFSSQFVSGLLMALPLLEGDSEIVLTSPLQSAAYVDMTLQTLRRFGVHVVQKCDGFGVRGAQRYRSPGTLQPEGDWSSAAFYLAAGALGGDVRVTGLSHESKQPDRVIMELLSRMGAHIERLHDGVRASDGGPLRGIDVSLEQCPDLMPVLAALAAFADGATHLTGAARLRTKESDRLFAMAQGLGQLGVQVVARPDGLVIRGGGFHAGRVNSYDDHRIAMALSIAALAGNAAVELEGAEAVEKSDPGFLRELNALGGVTHVI